MISPLSPPEVGAAVVCFCVSYEGPMFPRSFNDGRETKVILHMRTYTVVWTIHLTCWWPAWRSIPDPAGQTLGIPPRDLCCPGQGVLWRGTHLALYSGTKGKSTKLSLQITWIHSMSAEPIACAEVNSWLTVSAFRAAILKPPTYGFIPLFHTKRYHCLHYVVGPREFSRPLASCHALPVLVNERYDILWSGKKQKINTGAWMNLASGQTHTAGSSFQDEGDSSYRS